jgi:hypothetical protein
MAIGLDPAPKQPPYPELDRVEYNLIESLELVSWPDRNIVQFNI